MPPVSTAIPRIRAKIPRTTLKPIQSGESTQSHDHVIWPVSFSVINTIVSSPRNPMPPLDDEDDDAMLFVFGV